jgi:hypothetical protein
MRRTGNRSLDPAIGSMGWATLKIGRGLDGAAPLAQPASAAIPVAALADSSFLRSMIRLLASLAPHRSAVLHWRP